SEGTRARDALGRARKRLKELVGKNPHGIPGQDVQDLVASTGLRPFAAGIEDPAVRRMLRWGEDPFPIEKAKAAMDALKKERRRIKEKVNAAFASFGKAVGAVARDENTVEVLLEGRCPWIPQLVALAPFVPLHPRTLKGGAGAFGADVFLANGAFSLEGRGAKPRPGLVNPLSVVHLLKRTDYLGPRPAMLRSVFCFTGEGPEEDLRRLKGGELQWVASPASTLRKAYDAFPGGITTPAGTTVLLRFRCDRPPFDRLEVRKAFALALDRGDLAKRLWPAPAEATRLVPAEVHGAQADVAMPKGSKAAARAALKALGLTGESFPWVELHFTDQPGEEDLAEAIVRQWERSLGVEAGLRIESPDEMAAVLRAGAFPVALNTVQGFVDDPEAWVALSRAGDPRGGLGWDDALYERLTAGAIDIDAFLARGEGALEGLQDVPGLRTKWENAKRGPKERGALRLALLGAAERRLLEAFVVVPLLFPRRAQAVQGVTGLGSTPAWSHPGFVGSLRAARR
ncbi:MAG: ABC transporter substrate-binding protein, partial [Planctomycetota bacterium]